MHQNRRHVLHLVNIKVKDSSNRKKKCNVHAVGQFT